jgi:ABC-type transport system substrate-binding protein
MVVLLLGALPSRLSAFLPPPYGGTVASALPDLPVTLDPTKATRESELQLLSLIYDTLYELPDSGPPRPHLVEPEPEVSADGKTWRARLRPGIQLQGGRALTAADAVASLRRTKRGASGYLLAPVVSIEAEGDRVLVLGLSRKAPELPLLLCASATSVAVDQHGQLQGTGPFRLHSRTPTSFLLRANLRHFAGRPYLDEIRLSVFERASAELATFQVGGVQLSLRGTNVFGGRPRYASAELESPILSTVALGVGRAKPHLADPLFRLALLRGIDRQRLGRLASVGRAEIADSPVPTALLRATPPRITFDRAAAIRLLARVAASHPGMRTDPGLADGRGRTRLSLLVDASRFEDAVVAGQIVADLDRLGLAASLEARPAADYEKRLEAGAYDLVLRRLSAPTPLTAAVLAGALSSAGERRVAERCLSTGRCGLREAASFMKWLPFVPLVHASRRVFYDARLGQVHLARQGFLRYADLYWTRGSR